MNGIPARRRARLALSVVGFALTLLVPAAAFGATATYSAVFPPKGSSSLATRPAITVTVYAANGVKGSANYSLTIDGVKVNPSITYTMSRYRKFRLTYGPTSDLVVGVHTAVVKVRDLKRKSSSYSWTFTVLAPPPPAPTDMTVTIEPTECLKCHVGYPARHPMAACGSCHADAGPVEGIAYGPSDPSAHTLGCMLDPVCHGGGGPFPHVLGSDCKSCHDGAHSGIPAAHGPASEDAHKSSGTFCTKSGCHNSSLTIEHFLRGENLSCASCHSSVDPDVRAAIESGTTACTACHDLTRTTHPSAGSAHAMPAVACADAGCHDQGDVVRVHAGACAACHALGKDPSTTCGECHAAQPHADLVGKHTAARVTCTAVGCHGVDAMGIHTKTGGPGCRACHSTNVTASLDCGSCHKAADAAKHAEAAVYHVGSSLTCVKAGCHGSGVIALHAEGLACATCHRSGLTATKNCVAAGCHVVDVSSTRLHPTYGTGHVAPVVTCTAADCHNRNVITLHATGGSSPGCVACHGLGKPALTLQCDNAACHLTQPSQHSIHPMEPADADIAIGDVVSGPHACSECHVSDLIPLHGARCAACHTASSGGLDMAAGCVQGACHSSGQKAMHAGVTEAHALPVAPSCVSSDCHSGGTNVAEIHELTIGVGAEAPGCAACHADGVTLTAVCATSGCHGADDPYPADAPHDDMTLAHTAGLPASCATTGCHASQLATLHAGSGGCATCHDGEGAATGQCATAGCHPDAVSSPLLHPEYGTAHAASLTGCVGTGCHVSDVTSIHTAGGTDAPGCAACHAVGRPALTLVCGTSGCHPAAAGSHSSHPVAPAAEAVTIGGVSFGIRACSECHVSLDLIRAHWNNCGACHPGAASRATFAGGCAQTGCHRIGPFTKHGTIEADHFLGTPQCDGQGCHSGGSNLAALHETEGCAVCHAPGKEPTQLCSTTGCHGAGDSHPANDPHPAMAAGHGSGLSGSCVKSGCHGGGLPQLHAGAGACSTCHFSGKTATATCVSTGCHTASVSAKHAGHQANVTSVGFKINNLNHGVRQCAECHGSTELQAVHGGQSGCIKCHPGVAETATPWAGGCDQAGCHSADSGRPMHANLNAAHTLDVAPGCFESYLCHVGGKDVALTHFMGDHCSTCHAPGKTATLECAQCHDNAATGDHKADHAECNECHAPYVWDPFTQAANKGAKLTPVHWSMFDAEWTLRIGRATIRPGYPYGDYTSLVFPGPIGGPGPYISEPYAGKTGTYYCYTCHTGAGKTWVHPGSDRFNCGSGGDCHAHHGNWDPAQGSESYNHNTPPANWIQTMKW